MNKTSVEYKKWRQIYSPEQGSSAGLMSDYVWTENLFSRQTIVRSALSFVAALFAGGLYLLNLWSGDGVWLLAAFAATSVFVYIGLAIQSRTGFLVLLNVLAVPIVFAAAYAGMSVASEWLIFSFMLHGCVAAVQLASSDKDLKGFLFFWSVFSSAMALFLLLG
jgi:hypothetical protein